MREDLELQLNWSSPNTSTRIRHFAESEEDMQHAAVIVSNDRQFHRALCVASLTYGWQLYYHVTRASDKLKSWLTGQRL